MYADEKHHVYEIFRFATEVVVQFIIYNSQFIIVIFLQFSIYNSSSGKDHFDQVRTGLGKCTA